MHVFLLKCGIALIKGQPCFIFQKFKGVIQFLRLRCLLPFEGAEGILSRATAGRAPLHPVSYLPSSCGCQIPCCASDYTKCWVQRLSLQPNYREAFTLPCCRHLHLLSWIAFQLHWADLIDATNYHGSLDAFSHGNTDMYAYKSWHLNLQSKSHPCILAAPFSSHIRVYKQK